MFEINDIKDRIKERKRADNYEQQLKIIVKTLQQWQKINHYQQLEKEQKAEFEAKIIKQEPFKK